MDKIELHDHREHTTPKDYLLFGLVIAGIFASSLLLQKYFGSPGLFEWMRFFMASFFIVFGLFKLLDLRGFAESYANYDLIAGKVKWYGWIYPFVEIGLGKAYLFNLSPTPVSIVVLVLMVIGSAGILRQLLSGKQIQCACLGTYIKLPLSTVSLTEDLAMAVMAAAMLWWVG